MKKVFVIVLTLAVSGVVVCAKNEEKAKKQEITKEEAIMKLTSTAFKEGETIPRKYTCDSADVSPPLAITDIPENAKSLAMICDDPDAPAGTWVHWVFFNLPADVTELPEGITGDLKPVMGGDTSVTMIQGITDFRRFGYGGPCPPRGPAHRYFFKLYALDTMLDFDTEAIEKGITAKALEGKMKEHVEAQATLMGKYQR
jgi:Raf kinase inhibitor-like YbhB/YbcL family protein